MVSAFLYVLGVIFAIISGVLNNIGTVLQKKVVNEHRDDAEFMKHLVKDKMWLLGLLLQLAIGSVFFMIAQLWVGPALIPGLMAAGLIALAIGSMKIVGETLKIDEKIGIALIIAGVTLLGFSNLAIDIINTDILEIGFITRTVFFTVGCIGFCIIFWILGKKIIKWRAILMSLASGFMFALSNFWISPLMGVIGKVFAGQFVIGELVYFIIASFLLPLTNIIGIGTLQTAFKTGQASNLIPIQQVPVQICPVLVYFFVFLLDAPSDLSIVLGTLGVVLIVISSFLLGKRQTQLEKITAPPKPEHI